MAEATENNIGRPSIKTVEVVEKLEAAFNKGYTIVEACQYAGINRQTYYNWIEEDAEFLDKMDQAQRYPNMKAKSVVLDAIEDGNYKAATWWLAHKAKDEFSTRVESTGPDGEPMTFALVEDVDAELNRMLERRAKRADAARRKNAGNPSKILEPQE